MPKYTMSASEVVYYEFEIDAETKEEAYEKAYKHCITSDDIVGEAGFQYDELKLEEEENV